MLRSALLAFALVLLTALPGFADEIHLKNGDRLTGRFVSLANGVVTWRPAAGGALRINWADVVTLDIDDPVYVTLNDMPPILTGVSASTSAGRVELMPGGPVNLTDIVAISYGKGGGGGGGAPSTSVITGGAGAGITATSGNTRLNSMRLNGDVDALIGANRYVATATQTHSKDNGIETARNWSLTGRYDRYLTSWLYAEANAVLLNDRYRDIDLRSAYGAGLGLQLLNTPRVKVSGAGGVGEVRQNFRSIPDFNYTAAFESGSVKIELVPDHVEFFHTDNGYFQITQGDQMFVQTQSGLRFGLGAGFVATLQTDWDFDRHPSPGRKSTDTTTAFTLGYRF